MTHKRDYSNRVIGRNDSIRAAVQKLDNNNIDTLIIDDDEHKIIGVFTMGDFRRAVLTGVNINDSVNTVANANYIKLREDATEEDIIATFNEHPMILSVPVLNSDEKLVGFFDRDSYPGLDNHFLLNESVIIVIMAGGKGTRLDPFTRILPKPLIPIGKDPIVKVIMDEFRLYGAKNFYLSVNEKSKMIKAYFADHDLPYGIEYIEESKPLGTAGALSQLNSVIKDDLIVSNCDILIKSCYVSMMKFHKKNEYDLTIIGSMQHYTIPYGVCELADDGDFDQILEKPENSYLVNTGMYIINYKVLSLIPNDEYFDMTNLICLAKRTGFKIGVFPVSEKSWLDVGQWEEYTKTINEMHILTLN